MHRLDTTREDFTRTRESPDEAGEVEEELLKQGTELEDDHRTREHPDKAKEERPKVGAPGWDEFTPSKIKEELVEFTSSLEPEEMIKEETPEWEGLTPSKVKEEPVDFTYRPELEDVNRTRGLPDEAKDELPKQRTELEELMGAERIKEEEPGWDKFMPSEVKEESVMFTCKPELKDVNRIRGLPDEAKEELPRRCTELEDVSRTQKLPDKAKEEMLKVDAPGWHVLKPSKVKEEPVKFSLKAGAGEAEGSGDD